RAAAETVARRWSTALRPSRPERRKRAITKFADPSDFGRAFMMLAGYALEVLAKGVIIAQRPNEVRERWKRLTHEHDLVALLAETGITLSEAAEKFAGRAAAAATWSGRYPVPKTADRMTQDLKWGWPSDLDVTTFHAVYRDLLAQFWKAERSELKVRLSL